MLFNSWTFLLFFIIIYSIYRSIGQHRLQNVLLLIGSYIFYGWWDWRFLSLLFISTVVDYHCALGMTRYPAKNKQFLLLSLLTNLGLLGFFKYFNFFNDSAIKMLSVLGFEGDFFTLNVLLPVGISFYTFQTMAYTIDVYRGKERATKDYLSFSLYVAYFPQLVAGPIERSTHLLPKIQQQRDLKKTDFICALELILMGYFKKVFIADGVAPIVDKCFGTPENYGGFGLILGVYLFALQIYGDFSGYTDIARGISRLIGIDLCLNFKQPYLSQNITEFWRRWHMSLSSWLRDYLYIPLGGNQKGKARTYANNMLTMLLGGLWHGAGWNFVLWGGLHGFYLAVHKVILKGRKTGFTQYTEAKKQNYRWGLRVFITFNLVCFAWIFFRSDSLISAFYYIQLIFQDNFFQKKALEPLVYFLFYGFFIILIDLLCFSRDAETPVGIHIPLLVRTPVYTCMMLLLLTIGSNDAKPFIYFQF